MKLSRHPLPQPRDQAPGARDRLRDLVRLLGRAARAHLRAQLPHPALDREHPGGHADRLAAAGRRRRAGARAVHAAAPARAGQARGRHRPADAAPGEKRYRAGARGHQRAARTSRSSRSRRSEIRVVLDAVAEKTLPIVPEIVGAAGARRAGRGGRGRAAHRPGSSGPAKTLARMAQRPHRARLGRGPRRVRSRRRRRSSSPGAGRARARGAGRHRPRADPAGARAEPDAAADPAKTGSRRTTVKLFGTDGLRGKAGRVPARPRLGAPARARARRAGSRSRVARRRVVVGGDTRESTPRDRRRPRRGAARGRVRRRARPASSRRPASRSSSSSSARRRRRRLGLAQPLRGQRHQDLRARRAQVARRGRGVPREEARSTGWAAERPTARRRAPPDPDPGLVATYVSRLKAERAGRPRRPSRPDRRGQRRRVPDRPAGAPPRRARASRRSTTRPTAATSTAAAARCIPRGWRAQTRESGAAMGVAFDGDADRSIFADETGRILDGDDVLWIVARDWKRKGTLPAGRRRRHRHVQLRPRGGAARGRASRSAAPPSATATSRA